MQDELQPKQVQRTPLPIVAGILTLISGGSRLIGIFVILVIAVVFAVAPRQSEHIPASFFLGIAAICLLITGVLAIIGGIYTLKRKSWAWALTGAIAAFVPFNLLGLTSIILVAMSKKEFEN